MDRKPFMKFKAIIKPLIPTVFMERYRSRYKHDDFSKFKFNIDATSDVKADIQKKYGHKQVSRSFVI